MAVRIAPQHTAASTRLPLTRGIRFPRHGCYGLWARRIPSRRPPRSSTPQTPPGGSGTRACDRRSVSLARPASACGTRCLRKPHCARRARFAAVSPGCLRCFPGTRCDALPLGHSSKALRFRRRGRACRSYLVRRFLAGNLRMLSIVRRIGRGSFNLSAMDGSAQWHSRRP
jgi:hypothetical protein